MSNKKDSLEVIRNTDSKQNVNERLVALSTSLNVLIIVMFFMKIMLVQETWAWRTIEGLYFPYAYEAIMYPYMLYVTYAVVMRYGKSQSVNNIKLLVMCCSLAFMFVPLLYLTFSEQLDLHGAIFSDFNPALNHMPYAEYLPVLCALALFLPYGVTPRTELEKEDDKYNKGP